MAKKPKLMRAYRLKLETVSEIERLAEEWECTHAEVIEAALAVIIHTVRDGQQEVVTRDVSRVPKLTKTLKRGPRPKGDKTR